MEGLKEGGPGRARWAGTLPAICPDVKRQKEPGGDGPAQGSLLVNREAEVSCLSSGQKKHRVSSLGDCQAQW